jgi:NAD(P)H dehydrogenase (quinone)
VIAVAAASGRLGHAILRALTHDFPGHPLLAVLRTPSRLDDLTGVERRTGDYASVESMTAALRGASALVLISAPVRPGCDRGLLHRNAIEAARRAGVRRVLFTSVIGSGLEMQTAFAATQTVNRQTEADLAVSGLDWVIARNGFYLDIDIARMKAAAAAGGIYASSAGTGRSNYISIDELAFATAQLIAGDRPARRTYNLVGESITVPALTRLVAEIFGLRLQHHAITDEQRLAALRADPLVIARGGEDIAQMLAGVAHGQRLGAFEVPSEFEAAAGRPCKSIRQMLIEIRGSADFLSHA